MKPDGMPDNYKVLAGGLASVLLGGLSAFGGLYAFGLVVGALPTPPRWVTSSPGVYVPIFRFLTWVPIIALCAFTITRFAPSPMVANLGLWAGVSGAVVLMVNAASSEYANGHSLVALATALWIELVLLIIGIPTLCALWKPRSQ